MRNADERLPLAIVGCRPSADHSWERIDVHQLVVRS